MTPILNVSLGFEPSNTDQPFDARSDFFCGDGYALSFKRMQGFRDHPRNLSPLHIAKGQQ